MIVVEGASNNITIRNNLIYDVINGVGGTYGIYIATATQTNIYLHNNSIHEIGDSGDSDCYGIFTNIFSTNGECINNIVIDVLGTATSLCFANLGINTTSGLVSSDETATGPDARHNETIANIYANATARDYHLMDGSYALNSGTDLSAYFTIDYEEDTRPYNSGAWDIGCDEGTPYLTSTSTSTTSTSTTSTSSSSTTTSITTTSITTTSTSTTSTSTSTTSTTSITISSSTTSTSSTSTTSTSTTSTSTSSTSTTTTPSYTIVESTIGAAGDYTTVAAWISDKAGDFVTADEQHKGILIDNTNYDITSTINVTGATTDLTRNWWLTSSPSIRHTGEEGTGARIRATGSINMISVSDDFIMDYVEIDGNSGSYTCNFGVTINNSGYCKIDSCILHGFKASAVSGAVVSVSGTGQDIEIWNNLVYDAIGDGVGGVTYGILLADSQNLIHLYNNTIDDIGQTGDINCHGFHVGTFTIWGYNRNNIVTRINGTTPLCFNEFTSWTNSHNISSDDTAPGTDYLRSRSAFNLFADHNNRDYHLVDGSVALNSGWDGSSYFTNDIDEDTRPYGVTWDRGCDESTTVITSTSTSSTSTSTSSTSTSSTSTSSTSTSSSTSTTVTLTSTSTSSSTTTSTSTSSTSTSTTSISTTTSTSTSSTTSTSTSTTTIAVVESTIGVTGDYSSISAWVTGQQGDFVSSDHIQKGILIDSNLNISSANTITGATTDSDHYWWLTVDEAERHTGTAGTGNKLTYTGSGTYFIQVEDDFVADWIELNGGGNDPYAGFYFFSSDSYCKVTNCIIHNVSTNGFFGGALYTSNADTVHLFNNLIYDISTGTMGGYGIRFSMTSSEILIYNNTVKFETTVSGQCICIISDIDASTIEIRNNISVTETEAYIYCFVGNMGTASDNISTDSTAPGAGSFINQSLADLFKDYTTDDYYPDTINSAAMNNGYDLSTYFTNDLGGNSRPFGSDWEIGCYESIITVVESTIGAAGDYTTVAAWESSQQGDFVLNDQVQKGILIDNTNYDSSTEITISGATTDEDHYWWLTSSDSVRHTGKEGTGARLRSTADLAAILTINDDAVIEYIEFDGNSNGTNIGIQINSGGYCKINSCIIHNIQSSLGNSGIRVITGTSHILEIWNNLIYDISSTGTTGVQYGIYISTATQELMRIYNNTVDDIGDSNDETCYGIYLNTFTVWGYNQNNIVTRIQGTSTSVCFANFVGWTNSYNMSSDDTAPGPSYLRGRDDPYIIYADHNNRDYHLVDGSVALNSGTELSTYFTHDIDEDTRPYSSGVWDRGCDEGEPFVTSTTTSTSSSTTSTTTTI